MNKYGVGDEVVLIDDLGYQYKEYNNMFATIIKLDNHGNLDCYILSFNDGEDDYNTFWFDHEIDHDKTLQHKRQKIIEKL